MEAISSHAVAPVDGYIARMGMAGQAFGYAAAEFTTAISRLRNGANVTLPTVEALEAFIAANPNGIHVPRPGSKSAI